jgi:hypothetical protein
MPNIASLLAIDRLPMTHRRDQSRGRTWHPGYSPSATVRSCVSSGSIADSSTRPPTSASTGEALRPDRSPARGATGSGSLSSSPKSAAWWSRPLACVPGQDRVCRAVGRGSTLGPWRRHGIYRALVAHRARLAVALDRRYLQVDASESSRPSWSAWDSSPSPRPRPTCGLPDRTHEPCAQPVSRRGRVFVPLAAGGRGRHRVIGRRPRLHAPGSAAPRRLSLGGAGGTGPGERYEARSIIAFRRRRSASQARRSRRRSPSVVPPQMPFSWLVTRA